MINIKVTTSKNKRKMVEAQANTDNVDKLMVPYVDNSGNSKGFSCKQCKKQLKSKGGMENHIIKMHLENNIHTGNVLKQSG